MLFFTQLPPLIFFAPTDYTPLVQKLGHINVFLELWAQLFQENLGTARLAMKLEGRLGGLCLHDL